MLAKSPLLRYLDYDSLITDLRKAESAVQGNAPITETSELLRTTGSIPVVIRRKSQLPVIIGVLAAVVSRQDHRLCRGHPKENPAAAGGRLHADPGTDPGSHAYPASHSVRNKNRPVPVSQNPDTKSVLLTGNFDQWHAEPMVTDKSGNWTISKELPRSVTLEYQFIVDDKKAPDPLKLNSRFPLTTAR